MKPLPTLALDQLTLIGTRPAEFVDLAARAGFTAISPWLGAVQYPALPAAHLRAGDAETVAMMKRLRDTGVRVIQGDGFGLPSDAPMDAYREGIFLMAEIGASNILSLLFDSDEARGFDRFCQLDAWAKEAGLGIVLEFTPLSRLATLDDALAFIARLGSDNVGLMVDFLHLAQSGGTATDLARVPPGLIRGVQICDGPGVLPQEDYFRAATHHRDWPGEGKLPVTDYLRALPEGVVIGVEVPRDEPGQSLAERAQRAMETGTAALRRAAAQD